MKKILLATLLAGLVGTSHAQVSLTGKLSMFGDTTSVNGTRATVLSSEPTDNFAITAKEKVGKMEFRAVVETSVQGNTFGGSDTQLGDRQRTVGLQMQNVSVDVGRNVHNHFLNIATFDTFGTGYGSIAGDVHNLRGLRLSDAVFVSVNPMKNVSVGFNKTQGLPQEATVFSGSAKFGPVETTVSNFEQGVEKSTAASAKLALGSSALSVIYSDDKGLVNVKGASVHAEHALNKQLSLKASYGKTNNERDAYSVGAAYNFSKRTQMLAAFRTVDSKASNTEVKQVGLGLIHKF